MNDQSVPPFSAGNSPANDPTPADVLRALLARAELSQRGAAKLLGIDERTMRMWCAGQGVAPDYVYRALDPRLTFVDHLRERIEGNNRLIDALENGRNHEIPRDYRPSTPEKTQAELTHLRMRNDTYSSLLGLDEKFNEMREAYSGLLEQWLITHGFGVTYERLQTLEATEQAFIAAKEAMDLVAQRIRKQHPFGKFVGADLATRAE